MEVLPGSRLEVLWEVRRDSGKKSVWWGAVVRNVLNPTRPTAKRNATIRYDAMHGYEAADCNVVFISTSVLEAVEGAKSRVHHLWRWEASPRVSPGARTALTSAVEELGTEKQYEVHATDDEECGRSADRHAGYSALSTRLHLLESQVRELKADGRSSVLHKSGICSRALLFAKHKLGMELSKPLPGTASLKKYRDAHTATQVRLSVDADCALDEFESICGLATSLSSLGTSVHPWLPRSNSFRVPSSYKIMFESYQDLCKVLGVSCSADVSETMLKIKLDKRDNTPLAVRVLGGLKQGGKVTDPMFLAVGSSISTHADLESPLHVLFRKSQAWNPVEGSFSEPLVARTALLSEIGAVENEDDEDSLENAEGAQEETPVFEITWRRTSVLVETLFEAGKREAILGTLEVYVPFVLFRGVALCAEVAKVCNEEFIKGIVRE
jgi:hypothetical protein